MSASWDIEGARARAAGIAVRTPLLESRWLTDLTGQPIALKLECLQVTGSFKVRGAASKILGLDPETAAAGVIACSSGNHGLATAHVAAARGIPATICVPEWVDPVKLTAMRERGAEVVVEGATADESEEISFRLRDERGLTYVHPFDDPEVIAGQGTLARELVEDDRDLEAVLVPVAGGGLVAGIALGLEAIGSRVRVVGVYAERSPVMARSVAAGRPVRMSEDPTIATALAGGIGPENRYTLDLVTRMVDELVPVSEDAIHEAMKGLYRHHRLVVEGGGAVATAALLGGVAPAAGRVAVLVSGGNIDLGRFRELLDADRTEEPSSCSC